MADGSIRISLLHVSGRVPKPDFERAELVAMQRARTLVKAEAEGRIARHFVTGEMEEKQYFTAASSDGFEAGDTAEHSVFVHEGTPPHVIEPTEASKAAALAAYRAGERKTPHAYLRFFADGGPVFARRVEHPGYEGDPWLEESIFDNAERMEDFIVDEVEREWRFS